jgi:hypothetical protein
MVLRVPQCVQKILTEGLRGPCTQTDAVHQLAKTICPYHLRT